MSVTTDPDGWRAWVEHEGIASEHVSAVLLLIDQLQQCATSRGITAAAARYAGGVSPDSRALLRAEVQRLDVVIDEVRTIQPRAGLTTEALAELSGMLGTRQRVLAETLSRGAPLPSPPVPAAPAAPEAPAAPAVSPAPAAAVATPIQAPPPPVTPSPFIPGPPRPTLREFLSDHSILLLSYTGAFLLFVATLLFELYAKDKLDGQLRFVGVMILDLDFGAAGWICLRSRRLRVVAQTYIAVFALLAPLVLIAAYVFLGLSAEGISVHVAQLLAGATLNVLYSVLAARLRSHAYLFLALAAAAVAWFGALDQLSIDTWRGPALAPLAGGYALVIAWSRRVPWLGETFARCAILFVHGAAFLALGFGARHTVVSGTWQPWVVTVTLAEIGAAYISLAAAASMAWAWPVGASVLLVAGAGAATDAGLAAWRGLAIGLLGLPAAFVARRAHLAWPAIHAAVGLGLPRQSPVRPRYAATRRRRSHAAASFGVVALAYSVRQALSGRAEWTLVTAITATLAALLAGPPLGLDPAVRAWQLVALAAAWGTKRPATRPTRERFQGGEGVLAAWRDWN